MQLLAQAEECLRKQRLMTPEHDNALDCYQKILRIDSTNVQAKVGISTIANMYKTWGDNYYTGSGGFSIDTEKAKMYYARYLTVAEYMLNTLHDDSIRPEYHEITQRLAATPTPTMTPTSTPTFTPTPDSFSCPPQPQGIDEILMQILPQDLDQYKSLKSREQQGEQLNARIITAIERIICDLQAIEQILTESYKQHPDEDVKERIQKTRITRQQYEKERESRL